MRTIQISIALAVGSAAASASPAPPQCVPELPEQPTLFAVAGVPVACWQLTGACLALTTHATVPHPAAIPPNAEIRDAGGTLSACAGTKCKPIGTRLTAELVASAKATAKAKAGGADWRDLVGRIQVTRDLTTVVVRSDGPATVWNVATDAQIKLALPPELARMKESPWFDAVEVVGDVLIATWAPCAGPCELGVVIDHLGNDRGSTFPSGVGIELDDRRVAVMGNEAEGSLTVIDIKSAKHTSIKLERNSVEDASIVKLGPDEVAAMWTGGGDGFTAARIRLGARPVVSSLGTISKCP